MLDNKYSTSWDSLRLIKLSSVMIWIIVKAVFLTSVTGSRRKRHLTWDTTAANGASAGDEEDIGMKATIDRFQTLSCA